MRALVTGAAGFIGSRLCELLLTRGDHVTGIDSFDPYYDVEQKRSNIASIARHDRFELVTGDLLTLELQTLLDGVDVVFHQAGQPGVRLSWSTHFYRYVELNVLTTQRLLEAPREHKLQRFVYASSSSVYGNADTFPVDESALPKPFSPYGVTKLAGEHLCSLYGENLGVPTVSLRYFTVYGPGQRPDMAMHRLFEGALDRRPFNLFGGGEQVRDFTYVDDVVAANLLAASRDIKPGEIINIAGGASASMTSVIEVIGDIIGTDVLLEHQPTELGDVRRTGGSIDRALELSGWAPQVDLRQGLERQAAWHRQRRTAPPG